MAGIKFNITRNPFSDHYLDTNLLKAAHGRVKIAL